MKYEVLLLKVKRNSCELFRGGRVIFFKFIWERQSELNKSVYVIEMFCSKHGRLHYSGSVK